MRSILFLTFILLLFQLQFQSSDASPIPKSGPVVKTSTDPRTDAIAGAVAVRGAGLAAAKKKSIKKTRAQGNIVIRRPFQQDKGSVHPIGQVRKQVNSPHGLGELDGPVNARLSQLHANRRRKGKFERQVRKEVGGDNVQYNRLKKTLKEYGTAERLMWAV